MRELPSALLGGLADADRAAAQRWWATLADGDREAVVLVTDEKCEECFFGIPGNKELPPLVFGRQFIPHDDAWALDEWETDWLEYLNEHSDVVLSARFETRCFRNGDGAVCVVVDWAMTRFRGAELPPSEQWKAELDTPRVGVH